MHPSRQLITHTRYFAGDLLGAVLKDPDSTSRVMLTIHELLENTLKYSSDGVAELVLLVGEESGGRRRVEIRASNRTTPQRATELYQRIEALQQATDPMAVYVTMLRETAHREGSGLGLARIRVEGEMDLSYARSGDEVTVSASAPLV